MRLKTTDRLKALLAAAAEYEEEALFLGERDANAVNWATLKRAHDVLRKRGKTISLRAECAGSGLALDPPAERQVSAEFRKKLDGLSRDLEAREYHKLVKDVVPAPRESGILPTTRLQLSLGLHFGVTMGLGWVMGWSAGRAFENEGHGAIWGSLGGALGVIGALLLETVLFIARSSGVPGAGQKYLRYSDPKRYADMQKPNTVDVRYEFQTTPASRRAKSSEAKKER